MVFVPIRIISGFCLIFLSISSCGFSDNAVSGREPDPRKMVPADSLAGRTTSVNTEFFEAAHILITWDTAGDSLSDSDAESFALIRDIQDEMLSGQATFEEMAFNYSHCTSAADSGRLPLFTSGGITVELDSTVSALEPGGVSGIIATRFGYHLVKRLGS